ncbi:MAG: saccharopine dehydrogenase [Lysobacteraceae bacterium]|nr:MAG: saccharopine dehydrogenase [Xanthomonadaceae bacterium]
MSAPEHDLVVFGATSFVGRILCRRLLERFGVDRGLRWAIAGRSPERLADLAQALGAQASRLPRIVADAADAEALRRMCASTRVVVSTAGPYSLLGEPLVRACAESGTDYCDLTGEAPWIRRMISRYASAARSSGARIVHACGFDAIPSDLGVWFLQREAVRRLGTPCQRVKMRVRTLRGGVSGGTVASMMQVIEEVRRDPALRRELANPYALCPEDRRPSVRQPATRGPVFDTDFQSWTAPFVMAAINTRIVHRSHALSHWPWGEDFAYDEAILTGPGLRGRLRATAVTAGLAGFAMATALPPTRGLLRRFVVPKPGEGPSPEEQERGRFDLRFLGRTADGARLRVRVTGDRDPGYGSTAKMLAEAAACLAQDLSDAGAGGFWTPSTLMGERLLGRLREHAGLTFELED